jgi:addiction module HigA family antidote
MQQVAHLGTIIRDLCLKPLGLSVTEAAQGLGISRKTLSHILNGHAGISADMAVRLSKAFGRSPESWLQLQLRYDLAAVKEHSAGICVRSFVAHTAHAH